MLNYNHLYYFYVTVREGSVSAASRFLHVSQPALSSQIKNLESALGVSLFERRGKKLVPTPQGKIAYGHASQMFDLSAEMVTSINNKPREGVPIKMAVSDEVERPFAVNLVRMLFNTWGGEIRPTVSFTTGENDELMGELREWMEDVVITNRPTSFEDLEILDTLPMPVFLAVSAPRSGRVNTIECTPKEVAAFLQKQGPGLAHPVSRLKLRSEIDDFLSRHGLMRQTVFESDTPATIVRAILDNVGVGFVPLPYIFREVSRHEVVILGPREGLWKHTLYLVAKREKKNSPQVTGLTTAFAAVKKEISSGIQNLKFSRWKGNIQDRLQSLAK